MIIYNLEIDEDLEDQSGAFAISIVENPAIEEPVMFFSEHRKMKFDITNEEEQIISGPILIADKPIYRNNEQFGEHYVTFGKDTIKKIMQKYYMSGFQNSSNLEHNDLLKLDGITLYESYQVNRDRGINPPKGYSEVADGSWFGSMKVQDKETWDMIKNGDFNGFSIEGIFQYTDGVEVDDEVDVEEFVKTVDTLLAYIEKG